LTRDAKGDRLILPMSTKVGSDTESPTLKLRDYLTVAEAAALVGVSPWTLRNWDNNGKLTSLRHPKNGYRMYRRQDLDELLHQGRLHLHDRLAPQVDWSALGGCDHFVQFYESDAFLAAAVSRFIADALRAGEGAVIIATAAHRNAIQRKLRRSGLDLGSARRAGRFVSLDAADTLARFMVDGSPDPGRFRDVVGGVVTRAARGRSRVRAFGEMVALLWAEGSRDAAVALEDLWNDLRTHHSFILQCAYPMDGFSADEATAFGDVCACHSSVIPAESYAALPNEDARLKAIAQLQQKAQAWGAEVAKRKRFEELLRNAARHLPDQVRKELLDALS
jgi:excisionase family DNA binding protein